MASVKRFPYLRDEIGVVRPESPGTEFELNGSKINEEDRQKDSF